MPPFCPPQILFRLILGLLPVLSTQKELDMLQVLKHKVHTHKHQCSSTLPDLYSRVHMVVDIIILQYSMTVIIEINSNLETEIIQNESYKTRSKTKHEVKQVKDLLTCLPLCILFRLRTGVLPVVTHTPARVLLYTSFSSITP